jgi:hypothetical protein
MLKRTRNKQFQSKTRAKARNANAKFQYRPPSPDSETQVDVSRSSCKNSEQGVQMSDSAMLFWDKLYKDHEAETLQIWLEKAAVPVGKSLPKVKPVMYETFADAVANKPIPKLAPTGSILFAKKRKLQQLVIPRVLLTSIDLESPNFRMDNLPQNHRSDESELVREENCGLKNFFNTLESDHSNSSQSSEDSDQYVFVGNAGLDEWELLPND